MAPPLPSLERQHGFTLVELIMVIVIMGVIGGIVSVFMRSPIDAYFASARRAALTDVADTTARRVARDVQRALPNSIRTPTSQCIEFIPTKTGGRYRADLDAGGGGDFLDFTAADTHFNMLGSNSTFAGGALPPDQRIAIGDVIAVYNLGITGADAYLQDNTSAVVAPTPFAPASALAETTITIAPKRFPLASDGHRFHVIPAGEKVVAYVCDGTAGNLNLHRTVNSADFSSSCPASGPILARKLNSCYFDYSGPDLQRNALIRMVLQFTDSGEAVTLQHEVHVSNAP